MLSAPPSSSAPMPQDNTIVLSMSLRKWLSFLLMILGTRYLSSFFPFTCSSQVDFCSFPL
jgi:hypothetical protein